MKKRRSVELHRTVTQFKEEIQKENPRTKVFEALFDRLYHLAARDPLTGLFSRRVLDETLGIEVVHAIQNGQPLSMIMLDIDNFKQYNDKYGHLQGDEALKTVSLIIQGSVREEDFVARYGGEEFMIILPNTHLSQAKERAEKIRRYVEKTEIRPFKKGIRLPRGYKRITVSAGVAALPEKDGQRMLHFADKALYEAKRLGKNIVYVINKDRGVM